MGLYAIPIRAEKIEAIPSLLQSIGLPLIRTESRENGVYYFYSNPKRPNKDWAFWVTHEVKGRPRFFMSGLSRVSSQIVQSLRNEGYFENYEGNAWIEAVSGRKVE